MNTNFSWFFDEDYVEEAYLGRGGFGSVYRVNVGGDAFAIKQVHARNGPTERWYQQRLDHPNILKCLAGKKAPAGQYDLLLEYAPFGSLQSVIEAYGYVERWTAYGFYRQLLSALKHMHEKDFCHWDLHPKNILVFSTKLIKLGDFGCTCTMGTDFEVLRSGHRGPPEASDGLWEDGIQLDLWCAAFVYLRCLIGKRPWEKASMGCPEYAAFQRDNLHALIAMDQRWKLASADFRFLRRILHHDPKQRLVPSCYS
uniref:Protein kinase domain-containing protein n=2 Tax=Steinernema glaseri TaxID=37863 RepID=A0A1I7YYX0_9BILA